MSLRVPASSTTPQYVRRCSLLIPYLIAIAAFAADFTYEVYYPVPSAAPATGGTVGGLVIDLTGGPYPNATVSTTTADGGGSTWSWGQCKLSGGDELRVRFQGESGNMPASLPSALWCNGSNGGNTYHLKLVPQSFTADYSYSLVSDSANLKAGETQMWVLPLPAGFTYPTGIIQCKKNDNSTWTGVRMSIVGDAGGGSDRHAWAEFGAAAVAASGYCDIPRTGTTPYRVNRTLTRY